MGKDRFRKSMMVATRRFWGALVGVLIALAGHSAWAQSAIGETQDASLASQSQADTGLQTEMATDPTATIDLSTLFGVELTTTNILTFAVMVLVLGLIAYSLVASGKKGWGWVSLLVAASVLAFMGRMCVAIFREMAGGRCPSDWDEG